LQTPGLAMISAIGALSVLRVLEIQRKPDPITTFAFKNVPTGAFFCYSAALILWFITLCATEL